MFAYALLKQDMRVASWIPGLILIGTAFLALPYIVIASPLAFLHRFVLLEIFWNAINKK